MKKLLSSLLILSTLFLFAPHAYAVTYATWDGAHCDSAFTLSGGNLTITHTGANAWRSCLATIGKSSGKWYWEIHIDNDAGTAKDGEMAAAAGPSTLTLTSYPGQTGWAWEAQGGAGASNKWDNNVSASYGTAYTTGDYLGVAIDMGAGTITYYFNCTSQGVAHSDLTGTIFAATGAFYLNKAYTANFGASAFHCTVPAGYCQGLSDTCVGAATPFKFWQFFGF